MGKEDFSVWFKERCSDALFAVSQVERFLEDERKNIVDKIRDCEDKKEEHMLRLKAHKVCDRKESIKDVRSVLVDMVEIAGNDFLATKDVVINTMVVFKRKKEKDQIDRETSIAMMRKHEKFSLNGSR